VLALAERHDLQVVEDCAVALGARVGDTHVGLLGDAGCFSFYPVKHITTGEGGMVISTRAELVERVGKQRAFGIDKSVLADRRHSGAYDVELLGLNYRLGEIGAAIGVVQMGRLPGFLEHRAALYARLWEGLSEIDELELIDSRGDGRLRASHYCLSAVLRGGDREAVIDGLKARGIGTSVYYPLALPDTTYYAERYGYPKGSCPNATRISSASIAFPVGPHVALEEADRIVSSVKEVLADARA
jgi:dTDP-4-amino-4,6-dideoxygalactose transaminase